jgi:hypothetical protein
MPIGKRDILRRGFGLKHVTAKKRSPTHVGLRSDCGAHLADSNLHGSPSSRHFKSLTSSSSIASCQDTECKHRSLRATATKHAARNTETGHLQTVCPAEKLCCALRMGLPLQCTSPFNQPTPSVAEAQCPSTVHTSLQMLVQMQESHLHWVHDTHDCLPLKRGAQVLSLQDSQQSSSMAQSTGLYEQTVWLGSAH